MGPTYWQLHTPDPQPGWPQETCRAWFRDWVPYPHASFASAAWTRAAPGGGGRVRNRYCCPRASNATLFCLPIWKRESASAPGSGCCRVQCWVCPMGWSLSTGNGPSGSAARRNLPARRWMAVRFQDAFSKASLVDYSIGVVLFYALIPRSRSERRRSSSTPTSIRVEITI